MQELRCHVINLKSLDQKIEDSIVVGAGDANGRTLAVILTQEAAARFTPSTNLYLSWKHNETGVEGLNVFTKVKDNPATWEIKYPQPMLTKGTVLASFKIIDEISIDCSTNFLITVLSDLNTDEYLELDESYGIFKQAALELNNTNKEMQEQMARYKEVFQEKMETLDNLKEELAQMIKDAVGDIPEEYTNCATYIGAVETNLKKQVDEAVEKMKIYTDLQLNLNEY